MRFGPGLATMLAAWLALGDARGQDSSERSTRFLDAVGPPSLPGLTHPDWAFGFEYGVAAVEPTDVISYEPIQSGRAFAYAARWLLDAPIDERHWYAGVSAGVAAASVPSGETARTGGSALLLGNPETWVRGIWSSQTGLSAGGALSLIIPAPRSFSALEAEVVRVVRAVRPSDYAQYDDLRLTPRPQLMMRHVVGPVILQLQQGVDAAILLRKAKDGENPYDLASQSHAYVGARPFDALQGGLELSVLYHLNANLASPDCLAPCDERRVQVTLSPSVRYELGPIATSVSVVVPVSTPLRGEVESFVAGRLHLEVLF
jgi:hypothetical protein